MGVFATWMMPPLRTVMRSNCASVLTVISRERRRAWTSGFSASTWAAVVAEVSRMRVPSLTVRLVELMFVAAAARATRLGVLPVVRTWNPFVASYRRKLFSERLVIQAGAMPFVKLTPPATMTRSASEAPATPSFPEV